MPTHQQPRGVHRGIRQILCGPAQGTPQGPIPYTPAQSLHRTPSKPQVFHHSQQGITGGHLEYKRGNVHMS